MTAVEMTRFRTREGRARDVIALRPAMIEAFRADVPGFVRADLVQLGEDEWLDFIVWATPEDLADSLAHATAPAIAAFFDLITETLSQESGTLAD